MGKYGVFIPYHSHQAILIPISISMKLDWRFPFPWESHGTHGNHGNFQYMLISNLHSLAACCTSLLFFFRSQMKFYTVMLLNKSVVQSVSRNGVSFKIMLSAIGSNAKFFLI